MARSGVSVQREGSFGIGGAFGKRARHLGLRPVEFGHYTQWVDITGMGPCCRVAWSAHQCARGALLFPRSRLYVKMRRNSCDEFLALSLSLWQKSSLGELWHWGYRFYALNSSKKN